MKILFLTQLFPYPLDSGGRIKTYHTLRCLAGEHEVTLLTFLRNERERSLLPEVEKICYEVRTCPLRRSRLRDAAWLARTTAAGGSFLVRRDYTAQMQALVNESVQREQFEVIHIDRLQMAQYLPADRQAVVVLDQHNIESDIVAQLAANATGLTRTVLCAEEKKLRHFEARACARAQQVLCVSEGDREGLWRLVKRYAPEAPPPTLHVVPIGVDCEKLKPTGEGKEEGRLLFLGALNWPPNVEALNWFANEIWPRILRQQPAARLRIVGTGSSRSVRRLAGRKGIELVGYVEDILPELHRAQAMVAPLRAGSGLRVKILNALAAGLAVVTTAVGYAGIEAAPGEQLLVADDAEAFAQAVVSLLKNPFLRLNLERSGRELVEQKYDWPIIERRLQQVYCAIEGKKAAYAAVG